MKLTKLRNLCVALVAVAISSSALANEDLIRKKLKAAIPAVMIDSVTESEMTGVYRVTMTTGEVLFVGKDGDYFVAGDMYSMKDSRIQNLSEKRRESDRAEKVASIKDERKIVFPAKGETKARIAVFTDIDCGYCRKLHREVPAMNDMGIEVSYLAYPRAGKGSDSYRKYVSAWCAEDKLDAMTKAKTGQKIPYKDCDNPVDEQFGLGQAIGISGTPAIVLEDGRLIPGYLTADKLGAALGLL